MAGTKAFVLLSGGLDSALCLTKAWTQFGTHNTKAISVYYGQRHKIELAHAEDVASYFGVEKVELNIPKQFFQGLHSGVLMDHDAAMPNKSYKELAGVSPSYVPFRNGTLLSVATAHALSQLQESETAVLYYGAHAEDAENFAYPDCTAEFNGAMANAIHQGTYYKVRLCTPLQWMNKYEIVKESLRLNSPVWLTRSCYAEGSASCGECPTCRSRLEAFANAGFTDPIKYAAHKRDLVLKENHANSVLSSWPIPRSRQYVQNQ